MRSADDQFTVLARANGLPVARLGLAIARKHIKTAVARNRVKRVIRESFRAEATELRGLDFVVMARCNLSGTENARLRTSLRKHWTRLRRKHAAPM